MNTLLLKSKMVLHGDNTSKLAEELKIARTTLYNKMNNKNDAEFTQGEIEIIATRYLLSSEELQDIFFSNKCHKKTH